MNISRILLQLIFRDEKATPHVALSRIYCALWSARRNSRRARLNHELVQPHRGAEVCESRVLLSAGTGQDIQQPDDSALEFGRPETGISPGIPTNSPGEIIVSLPVGDESDWFPRPDVDAPTILLPDGSKDPGDAEPGSSGLWTNESPRVESDDSDVSDSVIHDVVNQLLGGGWRTNDFRESADAAADQVLHRNAHEPNVILVAGDQDSHQSSVPAGYESDTTQGSGDKSADGVPSNGPFRTVPSAVTGTIVISDRSGTGIRNYLSDGIPAGRSINTSAFSPSGLLDTQSIRGENVQPRQPINAEAQEYSAWPIASAEAFFSQEWMAASQGAGRHQRHWSLIDKGSHIQPEVLPSESTTTGRLMKQQEATAKLLRHAVREAYSDDPLPLQITPGDTSEPGVRSTARQRTLRYEIQPRAPPASEQPGLHFVSRCGHADLLRRLRFSIAPRGPSLASTVCAKSVSDTFRSLS